MVKKKRTEEERIFVWSMVIATFVSFFSWNHDWHWGVNLFISFIWLGISCRIIQAMVDSYEKTDKKKIIKDDEFMKTIWKSDDGISVKIDYSSFDGNKTQRSILLKEIKKDQYDMREYIKNDERTIAEYQDDLKKLDKKDEHYILEKQEIMERIKDLKNDIKDYKKDKTLGTKVYLYGFCFLRNDYRNFKLSNILSYYDNAGNEIDACKFFSSLGSKTLVKELEDEIDFDI